MAGSSVVGALRVTLGLDSAQFTTGMKNAQTGLQRFAGIAKAGALAIGSAMVAAGGAMALAMKGIIDDADEMSKMAQKIGVPIDELSRLRYAAELSDISLDDLGKSLRRLSAAMLDTAEGGTGPASKAFTMLGIQVQDAAGHMRSSTSVIEDLAGRFAQMPDGVQKTALAMRIFGKSGADMIPLLNSGAEGLREMYEEAEQLGIVLDRDTGLAAERFNDNLTRLGKVKDGIVTKITAGMLPALEDLSNSLIVAAKDSNLLRGVGGALGWTLKALMSTVLALGGTFYALAGAIGIAAITAYKWANQDFAGAAASIVTHGARIQNTLDSLEAIHQGLWSGGAGPAVVIEGIEGVDTAATGAARSTRRLTDEQKALNDLMEEGRRTFEQTRTPAEVYAARVEELGRQLRASAIDQNTFTRAMLDARKAFESSDPSTQMWSNTTDAIQASAARAREDAAKRVADGLENFRDLQEDAYDATYDGVRGGLEAAADGNLGQYLASRLRDALFDGLATTLTDMLRGSRDGKGGTGGIGWLKAAGSMLKQFAGGFPGFATGGSFKVGGSPGKDKNFVGMNLSKGEMVDIRRPGQDRGGGQPVTFVLNSPVMTQDLLNQMNEIGAQAQVGAVRQATDIVRRSSAGMQQRQRRLGTV